MSEFKPNRLFNFPAPPAGGYQPRLHGQSGGPTEEDYRRDMAALQADMRATLGPKRCAQLWKDAAKRRPGPIPGVTRKFLQADQMMLKLYDKIRDGSLILDDSIDKNSPREVLTRKIAQKIYESWGPERTGNSVDAISMRLKRLIRAREVKAKTYREVLAEALIYPQRNALAPPLGTDLPLPK